jgi:hypothetical protein
MTETLPALTVRVCVCVCVCCTGDEPRALHVLGKYTAMEPHPQPENRYSIREKWSSVYFRVILPNMLICPTPAKTKPSMAPVTFWREPLAPV